MTHELSYLSPFNRARRVDRIFDPFFSRGLLNFGSAWPEERAFQPACDVEETNQEYRILMDLPGVPKESVTIQIEDQQLLVSGSRQRETENSDKDLHFVERAFGTFERRFTLPKDIDAARVNAQYREGVLTLTLPKSESAKPRKIPIQVN